MLNDQHTGTRSLNWRDTGSKGKTLYFYYFCEGLNNTRNLLRDCVNKTYVIGEQNINHHSYTEICVNVARDTISTLHIPQIFIVSY